MNRRFRASELSVHDVAQSIAPWRPHVDTTSPQGVVPPRASTGGEPVGGAPANDPTGSTTSADRDSQPTRPELAKGRKDSVASGGTEFQRELKKTQAVDALHTYIVASSGYDHRRAATILARVWTTLENQLGAARPERGTDPR